MRRRLILALGLALALGLFLKHPVTWAMIRWWRDPSEMVVPVAGVRPSSLTSSFGDPRSGHRRHQGIDIFAHRGTPVLAAAPGQVVRVGQDHLGGNVVWVAGAGARLYYYAHLSRFSVQPGKVVAAGDELGRVGNTGNARTTPPHLHFGIYPLSHGFRAVDPAPLLRRQARVVRAPRRA